MFLIIYHLISNLLECLKLNNCEFKRQFDFENDKEPDEDNSLNDLNRDDTRVGDGLRDTIDSEEDNSISNYGAEKETA